MKKIIATLIIIAALGFMIATNPTLDDYSKFMKQEIIDSNKNQSDAAKSITSLLGGLAGNVIASQTTRKNYVLFSTYKSDVYSQKNICIGIFGNFFNCTEENNKN